MLATEKDNQSSSESVFGLVADDIFDSGIVNGPQLEAQIEPGLELPSGDLPKQPSLNFAFLYLLMLIGIGFYLSQGRIWEQRILSPMSQPSFILSDFTNSQVDLLLPNLSLNNSGRVTHYVRTGEKISTLFHRFGLNEAEAPKVEQAIISLGKETDKILMPKPGRKVVIGLTKKGTLGRFRYQISRDQEVIVNRKVVNGISTYEAKLIDQPEFELQVAARGEIQTSFNAAAKTTRIPAEIIDDIADLFSSRLNFKKDFQTGDRFSVIYRQKMLKGAPGVAGPIIAVVFESDGKSYYALRYVGADGKGRYFDENGKVLGDSFLRFPLQFSKISSAFSDARFHPVLRIKRPHNGVDFAAATGTPVRTIGDGQIVFAGYKGPNGNMVKIRHNDRYTTEYLHLSSIAPGIRRGTMVSRGQLIGAVGSTGLSTGSHLHFGMFDQGRYVDPLKTALPNNGNLSRDKAIDKKYLSGLLLTLERYQQEELEGKANRTVSVIEKKHAN